MIGSTWLLLTVLLLIPALIMREPSLLLIAILIGLLGGLGRLWAKYLFANVEYSTSISATRAFHGDEIVFETQVTNRKLLPLPWFRLSEEVPAEVQFSKETTAALSANRRVLSAGLSLRWYHRVTRRYSALCTRRGSFRFGPAQLEAGDMFGFFRQTHTVHRPLYLLVYPRVVPLEQLGIPSRDLFGDIRIRRHLFEDPVRVVATRDYVPSDPMKRIHWKSTARVSRLQTRIFEPTTATEAAVFLDTRTVSPPLWGYNEHLFELAVLTAASIANYAAEKGIRIGLYVNQPARHTDRAIQIPPSRHPDQLMRMLEALAQVFPQEMTPISTLLQVHGKTLAWSATLVVVTAAPTEAILTVMHQYRRAGRRVALILTNEEGTPSAQTGIPTYTVATREAFDHVDRLSVRPVSE